MKTCHAAALSLVGWYLMISPAAQPNAPLNHWRIDESFDNALYCRNAQVEGVGGDLWNYDRPPLSIGSDPLGWKLPRSACIATDDPRLKGDQ